MATMIKLGRPGLPRGSVWDECGKTDIVQILISHQQDSIKSLQFSYYSNGVGSLSQVHGEHTGLNFNTIVLDHPSEFLTSISGEYYIDELISIVFGTNVKKYGPFGKTDRTEICTSYTSYKEFNYEFGPIMYGNIQMRCFGGFHGSSLKGNLNTIGVYVKPLEIVQPSGSGWCSTPKLLL